MDQSLAERLPERFRARHPELAAALVAATGPDRVATVDDVEARLRVTVPGTDRGQIIDALQKLERSSGTAGRFVVGRRGGKSRFQWHEPSNVGIGSEISPNGVAAPVAADAPPAPDVGPAAVSTDRAGGDATTATWGPDVPAPRPTLPPGVVRHAFHLRPGFLLHLDLPGDLTGREAERLSRFIGSLPLE